MSEALTLAYPAGIVLVAALLVALLPRKAGHALGALATLSALAISQLAPEGQHLETAFLGFEGAVFFEVDPFSRMLGTVVGILATAAVVYAYDSDAPKVMTAFALSYVGSTLGVIFAGDWLTLIFYWELMAVTSTLLVWHHGGEAVRAGYRYAIAHGIGGSLFLFAIVGHVAATGSIVIDGGIGAASAGTIAAFGGEASWPAVFAALGIGINCAFIGLHTWLPDTYPRPHVAASVFLSVFTTKTGAYVLYQAFPGNDLWLAYMGGAMAVYGVVFALLQHDMRALLSYHIQAQLGYIIAGIGLGGTKAVAGGMAHLFNNILFKALLFMAVGVVILRTGEEDLYELGGLWRKMPLTAAGFVFGALSITAIPGFNGFVSKGMVLDAAHHPYHFSTAQTEPLWYLLLLGAIGTLLSFIKLGYYVFLHGEYAGEVRDAGWGQTAAMLSVGLLCLFFGAYYHALIDVVPLAGELDLHPYSTGHLLETAALVAISLVTFAVIRKPLSKVGHVHDLERIVDPLVYHSGRGLVLGVTELYAAVDRAAVGLVRAFYWMGNNPVRTAAIATRRIPLVDLGLPDERRTADGAGRTDGARVAEPGDAGDRPSTIYLRAGMGTSILLVTAVLTIALLLLV